MMDAILQLLNDFVATDASAWFLFIPFSILIVCGLGVPLPEDVLLITMGFLVYNESGTLPMALTLGYLGIIIGDSIVFTLGLKYGHRILKVRLFSKVFTKERLRKAKKFTVDHGQKTVFLARFAPGLRTVVFFSCGTLKFKFSKFFLIDSLAAIISAPVFVILGYYFGEDIELLIEHIKRVDRVVIVILACAAAGVILLKKLYGRRKSKPAGSDDAEEQIKSEDR